MSQSTLSSRAGFDRFDLHPSLLRAVGAAGFESPRPIQTATIPAGLDGRDVLGLAQTGTGKTAAFALPLLHRLLARQAPGPRVLVLVPTRELAAQVTLEFRTLARYTRLTAAVIHGGVSPSRHIGQLRQRPDVVVGCPGRVLDLIQQGALRCDGVGSLVIDEADHMFDMGFLRDVRKILAALPARRQTLLFSATMPKEIRKLADEQLRNPHVVELSPAAPAETIDHALVPVAEALKRELLDRLLRHRDCTSAIVFTRTKHRTKRLAAYLQKTGHRAVGLQGNMSQNARDRAMAGFRGQQFDVLVATDIAARGLDVSGVSHVVNFDVPMTPDAYTHRIGRTGRAERTGIAFTFVTPNDDEWVRATERMLGRPIPRRPLTAFDAGKVPAGARGTRGGARSRVRQASPPAPDGPPARTIRSSRRRRNRRRAA